MNEVVIGTAANSTILHSTSCWRSIATIGRAVIVVARSCSHAFRCKVTCENQGQRHFKDKRDFVNDSPASLEVDCAQLTIASRVWTVLAEGERESGAVYDPIPLIPMREVHRSSILVAQPPEFRERYSRVRGG